MHVLSEVAPVAELAFPASHARQVSADVADGVELRVVSRLDDLLYCLRITSTHPYLYFPASHILQDPGPSTSLYFPAGQASQSVSDVDPLPNSHDEQVV